MAGSLNTYWSSINNEPKRKYKYIVSWGSVPWFVVSGVDLPKYENNVTEVNALNHTFKYPGRITWQDSSMEITDSEAIDCVKILMQKLVASGYAFPTGPNQYRTISKKGCVEALGQLIVAEITGGENEGPVYKIGEWKYTNAWIKSFDPGRKEYSSDDAQKITLNIVYDFAQYTGYPEGERPEVI